MADLSQGNHANVVLDAGEKLRVSTGGQATVTSAYGAPAGTTTINAGFQVFGPYAVPAKLRVLAVSGLCTYAQPTQVPVTADISTGEFSPPVSGAGNSSGALLMMGLGDSHKNNTFFTDGTSPDGLSPPAYYVAGATLNASRSWGFPSWVEALSLGRARYLRSFARQTNGLLTAGTSPVGVPISVQVTQMLADPLYPQCNMVSICPGFNDSAFALAAVLAELDAQFARISKPILLISPPPRSDATATTVGGDGMQAWAWYAKLRLELKRRADTSGGRIRFVDGYAAVNSPTATPDAWRAGYSYDTIHGNNAAGYAIGKAVVDELFPSGAGTNFELWRTAAWAGASGANGAVDQGFSNPTFATTTGGTLSIGSGNLPGGLTLTAIAGGSAGACAVAACDIPGGAGNMVTIPITSAAAGDGVDLTCASAHAAGGTFLSPGDTAYAQMLVRINSGGIYPRNLFFRLTGFNGTNYNGLMWEADAAKEVALPFTGSTVLLLRTPIITCPSGAALSSLTFKFRPTFAAAGSCSISISNPSIVRQRA